MIMTKVTIEIDEKYAGALSLTAIGSNGLQTNVAVVVIEISRCNLVSIDETGNVEKKMMQE